MEVKKWLNVKSAAKALCLVTMFPIPTAKQTECGSPISEKYVQLFRAHTKPFMFVPAACVPARLNVHKH